MATSDSTKSVRLLNKLAAVRAEQHRQMGFAGERLGVFAKLRELAREERRIVRQLETLVMVTADAAERR